MARGDDDPRPPIEIVGATPLVESLERVSVAPRGPRRPGGRWLAVGAGIALLLVGGLALGNGGAGSKEQDGPVEDTSTTSSSSTTTRPSTTTTRTPSTTTTTRPPGPVFGEPVGAGLLLYTASDWVLVDLDTGARTYVALPYRTSMGELAVPGGVVMVSSDGTRKVQMYTVDRDGTVGEPVALGLADQVLPSGHADRLWLLDGGGIANGGGFLNETIGVRLVDLRGQVLRSFQLTAPYVARGLDAGVVIERAGRVYLVDEGGTRAVAVGWSVGVIGDDLMVLTCDEQAACAVERQPVDGGSPIRLFDVADIETVGFESVTAPDGRVAIVGYGMGDQRLSLLGADGRSLGGLADDDATTFDVLPRWLPGDVGLVTISGREGAWIRPRGDGTWVSEPVPGFAEISPELALVIEW